MSSIAKVDRIRPEQVDPAYCVVNLFAPGLSLNEWRSFCASMGSAPGQDQIFVATNAKGHIKGLCVGGVETHPRHGQIFDAWLFCAVSMTGELCVACDLLRRLKEVARAENCDGIRLRTLGQDTLNKCLRHQEAALPDPDVVTLLDPEAPVPARWHL